MFNRTHKPNPCTVIGVSHINKEACQAGVSGRQHPLLGRAVSRQEVPTLASSIGVQHVSLVLYEMQKRQFS